MKKLMLTLVLLAASSGAVAQSDVSIGFNIIGGLQFVGGGEYDSVEMDINFGSNTLAVNGTMGSPNGLSSPATGTCFFTTNGGVFCNLQVDHLSLTLILQANLSGTITVKDAGGAPLDSAPVQRY